MKFTSEDLMKAMGLQVGDRVKVKYGYGDEIYTVIKKNEDIFIINTDIKEYISEILAYDYEILPRPKHVGELDCFVEIKCNKCTLRMISGCTNKEGIPLYDILQEIKIDITKNNMFDQEIYDLLKVRLDKEVEDD